MPSTIEEKSEQSSRMPVSAIKAEVPSPRREEIERKLVGVRQYTPNTRIDTPVWNPDISIYCHSCQQLVPARDIVPHKRLHRELRRFCLGDSVADVTPESLGAARRRRLQQLRRKRPAVGDSGDDEGVAAVSVERVNESYSFVKNFLFDERRGRLVLATKPAEPIPAYDVESSALHCSVPFVLGVGVARFRDKKFCVGNDGDNEGGSAFASVQDSFGGDAGKCFLGLFAGNFGDFAAKVASEELQHFLLCELRRFDPDTSCTCACNMAFGAAPLRHEIHRPLTAASEKQNLHFCSQNVVQHVIHSCQERLDAMAVDYSRAKTPDSLWHFKVDADLSADSWHFKVDAAFEKALHYVDGLLKRGQHQRRRSSVRWSGASVAAVLLRADEGTAAGVGGDRDGDSDRGGGGRRLGWAHAANCGDVRTLLLRNNVGTELSQAHTLLSESERLRVAAEPSAAAGGSRRRPLLQGVLAPTRGVGYHGDRRLKLCLSASPSCRCAEIDDECQAVVMVTPGVTDVLSCAEVSQVVSMHLPVNRVRADSDFSVDTQRRLLRSPTPAGSDSCDDEAEEDSDESLEISEAASSLSLSDFDAEDAIEAPPADAAATPTAPPASAESPTSVAEEVARLVVQAAVLAGSQGDVAAAVLLLPAAFE